MSELLSSKSLSSNSTLCLELAIEAERFCREGQLEKGIAFFHKALNVGTDDLNCLSAIYCQLGNAYFYRQNYRKAMEYHRWDLVLARRIGDLLSESQASGNLGNDLQKLNKYEEAIMCFSRQLDIARQLGDQKLEAPALYNLGTVYHIIGKQKAKSIGKSDPDEYPVCAAAAQRTAIDYYKQNLQLIRELNNRPAEGRAVGNLGNAYYLLGNFSDAISCYRKRLEIADEFGDLDAQRRAHANIGNAYIFSADFKAAVEHYQKAFQLAIKLNDVALQAQACYSLGNTYTLLRDPATAVIFHLRHLVIARHLEDRVGEGRAHWSLANAYCALKKYDRALRCSKRHSKIARELSDYTGYLTAQLMIQEIQNTQTLTSGSRSGIVGIVGGICSVGDRTDSRSGFQRSHSLQIHHHYNHQRQQSSENSSVSNKQQPQPNSSTTETTASSTLKLFNHSVKSATLNHYFPTLTIQSYCAYPVSSSLSKIDASSSADVDEDTVIHGNSINQTSHKNSSKDNLLITNDQTVGADTGDEDDDNDPNLDHELEQELLANSNGILDTVEFVTVTETGQTLVSRMGCLDVPNTSITTDSNRRTLAEFYMNTPTFRLNPNPNTDNNSCTNSGTSPSNNCRHHTVDVEDNLESITAVRPHHSNSDPNPSVANLRPTSSTSVTATAEADVDDEEALSSQQQEFFFSLLLKSQSRRMDEQRCFLRTNNNNNSGGGLLDAMTTNTTGDNGTITTSSMVNAAQTEQDEAFFDLIEGVQGDRMNDQRAVLPAFPGLRSGPGLQVLDDSQIGNSLGSCGRSDGLPEPHFYRSGHFSFTFSRHRSASTNSPRQRHIAQTNASDTSGLDDEFLDMILRLQAGTRIEDQRSDLPDPIINTVCNTNSVSETRTIHPTTNSTASSVTLSTCISTGGDPLPTVTATSSRVSAPTVPDEDFFALIQRVQSTRLDEQRCNPPLPPTMSPTSAVSLLTSTAAATTMMTEDDGERSSSEGAQLNMVGTAAES